MTGNGGCSPQPQESIANEERDFCRNRRNNMVQGRLSDASSCKNDGPPPTHHHDHDDACDESQQVKPPAAPAAGSSVGFTLPQQ
mmetsp:Transcript_2491/g.4250  ORF Transcript_2491/g.4250 Transcript_2491/m.4250 type:complete len:84 (-) Transcript_2491:127-378(-)